MRQLSNVPSLRGARVWYIHTEYVVVQEGSLADTVDIAPPGEHNAAVWTRDVPVADVIALGVLDVRQEQERFEKAFTRYVLDKNDRGVYMARQTREAFDVWMRSACARTRAVLDYRLPEGGHGVEFVQHGMRPVVMVYPDSVQMSWTENGRRQTFMAPVPEDWKRSPDGVLEDVPQLMREDFATDTRRREPHLPLAWNQELGYENPDVATRWEGFVAGWRAHDMRVAQVYTKPIWNGKGLPPIGADVLFDTSSNDNEVGTVVGYRTQGDLAGATHLHRVYIRLLYKDTLVPNERMLSDVRALDDLAQAAA